MGWSLYFWQLPLTLMHSQPRILYKSRLSLFYFIFAQQGKANLWLGLCITLKHFGLLWGRGFWLYIWCEPNWCDLQTVSVISESTNYKLFLFLLLQPELIQAMARCCRNPAVVLLLDLLPLSRPIFSLALRTFIRELLLGGRVFPIRGQLFLFFCFGLLPSLALGMGFPIFFSAWCFIAYTGIRKWAELRTSLPYGLAPGQRRRPVSIVWKRVLWKSSQGSMDMDQYG